MSTNNSEAVLQQYQGVGRQAGSPSMQPISKQNGTVERNNQNRGDGSPLNANDYGDSYQMNRNSNSQLDDINQKQY